MDKHMKDMSDALSSLTTNIKENKTSPEINKTLMQIKTHIFAESVDKKILLECMIEKNAIVTFSLILKSRDHFSDSSFALTAEILAEIAKLESGRKKCSEAVIIVPLLEHLSNHDSNVVLQVCRALGNICYDNDEARSLVKNHNGVERLIQLLKSLLERENLPANMRTITSGCLLNLTDTYEGIQDQAVDAGILDVLLQYLLKFSSEEEVVTHCLLVLSCLAESNHGRIKILEKSTLSSLLKMLDKPLSDEILDSLLELFSNLCEIDSVKLSLAEMGLCEKLVGIVQNYVKQETGGNVGFNLCKSVPDLIILILTGDASMEHLWKNGNGVVYKETLSWLKSSDENLVIAGAIAAGNFARKDGHCIKMLEDGVVDSLKVLLKKHNGKDGDIRMQHAVLSALRNMVIPVQNKAAIVKLGIVENLVEMMDVETFPVVFKLLGTLRMLVDKQENVATEVGKNFEFIERLVKWCNTEEHCGVQAEATRLLCWIAKSSKAPVVLQNISKDGLAPVIKMMKSEHAVMQNEALLAVTLISTVCINEVEELSLNTNLISILYQVMTGSKNVPELTQNALTLLLVLVTSEEIRKTIYDSPILAHLKSLKSSTDAKTKELSEKAMVMLEKPH